MKTIKKNQEGFGTLEFVLVFVIVILIGATGWFVYKHHRKSSTSITTVSTSRETKPTKNSTQTPSPNVVWKTATLQFEKISYQYPSNWTVTDRSQAVPKLQNGCTYPGHDLVTLNSPSGKQVILNAGEDCFGDDATKAFGSVPINALGQNLYLVFEGSTGLMESTMPNEACLAQSTNPDTSFDFKSRNIFYNGEGSSDTPVNSFCYIPYNPKDYKDAPPSFSVQQIKDSSDYNTSKQIFESMHY